MHPYMNRLTKTNRYLRSALSSIGTQATDITRRLDYTYYNLLERITALNSTIGSFQDLSDSASTLLNDFERETTGLDQEIRKQINELKGFEPQIQKADALEGRMKLGRQRVEDLGKRLETVRGEIDRWEQRESEWQSRISRRLRIFGITVTSALLVLVVALALQNWPVMRSPNLPRLSKVWNQSSSGADRSDTRGSIMIREGLHESRATEPPWYPSSLADRRESLDKANPSILVTPSFQAAPDATPTAHDPLHVLVDI